MSIIKAFTSSFHTLKSTYNGVEETLKQIYITMQHLGSGKVGMLTAPRWLSTVSTLNTIDASGSTRTVLAIAGHGHRQYDVIRFTSGANAGEEVQIIDASEIDSVLLGQQLPNTPGASDGYTLLRSMTPTLDSTGQISVVEGQTSVVDFLDGGSVVPTGGNAIPKSSDPPLEVVNSLAANVTKIQVISDIGEFINLYLDSAGATLVAHLPLTPDEVVDVDIPAGSTVYIRAAKDVDIDQDASIISMNFIG